MLTIEGADAPNVREPFYLGLQSNLTCQAVRVAFPNIRVPFPNVRVPFPNVRVPFPNVRMPFINVRVPFPNVREPFPNVRLSEYLFLTSESSFIWVYNQTLPV